MQSTQEITELMLDSNRNTLLALGLKVSIATLGLGTGALVAGLFGMNVSGVQLVITTDISVDIASGSVARRILHCFRISDRPGVTRLRLRTASPAEGSSGGPVSKLWSQPQRTGHW